MGRGFKSHAGVMLLASTIMLPFAPAEADLYSCIGPDGSILMQEYGGSGCTRWQSGARQEGARPLMQRGAPIEIISMRCEFERGYVHARGEIRNVSDRIFHFPKIVVTYRDRGGRLVASTFTYGEILPLGPGQRSPFDASVRQTPEIVSCEVVVQPGG